jgi:hypothetical protein
VPNSVLWLLSAPETTCQRLRDYAAERGIAPERLVFARKLANPHHLARYRLADLFLDTVPYGAHTTSSDALWMGVPVLTLSGRSFASRVCGSLVRAAGLPELVCTTADAYVERAIALGQQRAVLQRYRDRLEAGRESCVLFDMGLLVRRLEHLYMSMWRHFKAGTLPRPDLANLETYLEVGETVDHEAIEVGAIEDYRGWWITRLAQRHAVRSIRSDRRLWRGLAGGAGQADPMGCLRDNPVQPGRSNRSRRSGEAARPSARVVPGAQAHARDLQALAVPI